MSDFKWAHGPKANVKEPLSALRENGWQFADVPTASNFNWLFNELQKELESSKAVFGELKTRFDGLNSELKTMKERFTSELKNIREYAADIKNTAHQALHDGEENSSEIEFRTKLFYQLCELLKAQEEAIRRYHSSFPVHPWPRDGAHSRRDVGVRVLGSGHSE